MKKRNMKLMGHDHTSRMKDDGEAQQLASDKDSEDANSEEEHRNNLSDEENQDFDSEEEELQDHLADIPFEELQKVRSDGRESTFSKFKPDAKPSRANKNRPMEISSKKPVGRLREVVQGPKKVVRDPRFESLCGNFEEGRFRKIYSFIFDEELPKEREKLQKMLKSSKNPNAIGEIEKHLSWIDNQLRKVQDGKKHSSTKLSEHKKKEKEAVKKGKQPFYLKKSELRKQELTEKYESLKASGKLEAFLSKRRHKNAAKDHRYVPYRRPENTN